MIHGETAHIEEVIMKVSEAQIKLTDLEGTIKKPADKK